MLGDLDYSIPLVRQPTREEADVGECVYCRRKPPEVKLEEEHIVADGLGGDRVLANGSCRDCGEITSRFEGKVARSLFADVRGSLGIRSRKKPGKKRSQKQSDFKLVVESGDIEEERSFPYSPDLPSILFQYQADFPPGALMGWNKDRENPTRFNAVIPAELEKFINERIGAVGFSIKKKLRLNDIYRNLGKIAHCVAVASIGLVHFKPYLVNMILHDDMSDIGYYFGTLNGGQPTDSLHQVLIGWRRKEVQTVLGMAYVKLVIVLIRFFANREQSIHYLMVAGEYTGDESSLPEFPVVPSEGLGSFA